jgi:hypothetical protein
VIGGLAFATVSTLLFVPVVFAAVRERLAPSDASRGAGYPQQALQHGD